MLGQVRSTHQRLFLWLLALALLTFVASLFPEVRRRLWLQAPDPESERG